MIIEKIIDYFKPTKKIRTEFNYSKEGFSQIFPILRIKNDKETAWVFGFGKKNFAIVSGENDDYNAKRVDGLMQSVKGLPDDTRLGKLSNAQKVAVLVVLGGVFIAGGYILYRAYKNKK